MAMAKAGNGNGKAMAMGDIETWSVDFARYAGAHREDAPEAATEAASVDGDVPSVVGVGLRVVRGAMDGLSRRLRRSRRKGPTENREATPTPVQLRLWPALLRSFESRDAPGRSAAPNVVGIAPTGTGKTMAYAAPVVSNCVRTLLCQMNSPRPKRPAVHGLVLVPTRELAIQVAKELKAVAKVANKYLSKFAGGGDGAAGTSPSSMKVKSIAVYGGVDIEPQLTSILGRGDPSGQRSLVVVATPGRLMDILQKSDANKSAASAFADLRAVVFDEADRMAGNADMAGQVDEILSILNTVKMGPRPEDDRGVPKSGVCDVVSCLVSATLPEKARETCDRWVQRPRVVVKVDNVKVAEKQQIDTVDTNVGYAKEMPSAMSAGKGKKRSDLGSIPSNIVQTLHVCSNHKKPKKLVLTLQRIYSEKGPEKERHSVNNRLCIVFFAQIKSVKYAFKLLVKEGLRCVELYGSLNQTERERRLLDFKCGKTPILLATDVAARGLHIPNVNFVVNYDFPDSLDQYVHRCGRAGRKHALNGGDASRHPPTVYSFFPREFPGEYVDSMVDLLKASNAWVDPNLLALRNKFLEDPKRSGRKRNRRKGKAADGEDKSGEDEDDNDVDSEFSKSLEKSSKKSGKKRKRRKGKEAGNENKTGEDEDDDDADNEFSFLGRIVLKRASHVSDAEDSDGDSE